MRAVGLFWICGYFYLDFEIRFDYHGQMNKVEQMAVAEMLIQAGLITPIFDRQDEIVDYCILPAAQKIIASMTPKSKAKSKPKPKKLAKKYGVSAGWLRRNFKNFDENQVDQEMGRRLKLLHDHFYTNDQAKQKLGCDPMSFVLDGSLASPIEDRQQALFWRRDTIDSFASGSCGTNPSWITPDELASLTGLHIRSLNRILHTKCSGAPGILEHVLEIEFFYHRTFYARDFFTQFFAEWRMKRAKRYWRCASAPAC